MVQLLHTASNKLEYGARTIRPKIERLLPEYLTPFQDVLPGDPSDMHDIPMVDWDAAYASLKINRDVKPVNWLNPGYSAGLEMIDSFINTRLKTYGDLRNDPNVDTASHLSPYAHFGQVYINRAKFSFVDSYLKNFVLVLQISMQATVLRIKGHKKHIDSTNSFVEEAIVRRELADNFCFYNQRYDQLSSCYEWVSEFQIHTPRRYHTPNKLYIGRRKRLYYRIPKIRVLTSIRKSSLNVPTHMTISGMLLSYKWFAKAKCMDFFECIGCVTCRQHDKYH